MKIKTLILKLKDKLWNRLFFLITLTIFIIISLFNLDRAKQVIIYFFNLLTKTIIPILFLVYFLIFIFNLLLDNKKIQEKLTNGKSHIKYILVIIWWILSSWPIYMRYPLLKKLKEAWLNRWHIASFIYAKSIKLPLFPIMIYYFWLKYTIIFSFVLLILSIFIWIIIDIINKYINFDN